MRRSWPCMGWTSTRPGTLRAWTLRWASAPRGCWCTGTGCASTALRGPRSSRSPTSATTFTSRFARGSLSSSRAPSASSWPTTGPPSASGRSAWSTIPSSG
uniref:Secreted protein n=1 Tax=Ixodes ricinus TaxID=34613 RepID=A0A6B0U6L7_IXORI